MIWTLLKADLARLQALHMRSLRRIIGVRFFDYVTNAEVKDRTRLEDMEPRMRRRRLAPFGHVALVQPEVSAHDALTGCAVWQRSRSMLEATPRAP